jgi:hypothetical protein
LARGKERTTAYGQAKPFPQLQREKYEQDMPVFLQTGATHASPHKAEKQKLSFPQIPTKAPQVDVSQKQAFADKPDIDHIITKIYDDVATSVTKDDQEHFSDLVQTAEGKKLFFEKIERLVQEGELSEEEIRNLVEKDLFATMKQHYESHKQGEVYLFDQQDFTKHVTSKVQHLQTLEQDWQKKQEYLEEMKEQVMAKEKEIAKHIDELKTLLGRYNAYEKDKLVTSVQNAAPLQNAAVVQAALALQEYATQDREPNEERLLAQLHPVVHKESPQHIELRQDASQISNVQASEQASEILLAKDAEEKNIGSARGELVGSTTFVEGTTTTNKELQQSETADAKRGVDAKSAVTESSDSLSETPEDARHDFQTLSLHAFASPPVVVPVASDRAMNLPSYVVLDRMLPSQKSFTFKDGTKVASLGELQKMISGVPLSVLEEHVQKGHFVPWLEEFGYRPLADTAARISRPEDFVTFVGQLKVL